MPCQRLIEEPLSSGIKTISSTLNFIARWLKQRSIIPYVWVAKSNSPNFSRLFFQGFFPSMIPKHLIEVVVVQGRHRIPFKVRIPTLNLGPNMATHPTGAVLVYRESLLKTDAWSSSFDMRRDSIFQPQHLFFLNYFLFFSGCATFTLWWNKCCVPQNWSVIILNSTSFPPIQNGYFGSPFPAGVAMWTWWTPGSVDFFWLKTHPANWWTWRMMVRHGREQGQGLLS